MVREPPTIMGLQHTSPRRVQKEVRVMRVLRRLMFQEGLQSPCLKPSAQQERERSFCGLAWSPRKSLPAARFGFSSPAAHKTPLALAGLAQGLAHSSRFCAARSGSSFALTSLNGLATTHLQRAKRNTGARSGLPLARVLHEIPEGPGFPGPRRGTGCAIPCHSQCELHSAQARCLVAADADAQGDAMQNAPAPGPVQCNGQVCHSAHKGLTFVFLFHAHVEMAAAVLHQLRSTAPKPCQGPLESVVDAERSLLRIEGPQPEQAGHVGEHPR
mmetsp:Transcript_72508/g.167976  ORF Transcript_72508/g.167976 Transcript_72508/m.167976 type:complete len:272 (-) Transcript_72508:695-1510(-)